MNGIYLDHAATSFPKAPGVPEAMVRYLTRVGANVNRSSYDAAEEAASVLLETRELLCELFGLTDGPRCALLTPGMTYSVNQVLRGYLNSGDHCIVSSMEHNAVMRPLTDLAARGVTISRIPADSRGITDPRDLLPLIRPNTKMVFVSHASNVSGSIFPLEEVGRICREQGIPLCVDAAQTAGHLPINMDKIGISALCLPGHKGLRGPQGIGALLVRKDFAKKLVPLVTGGTGSASHLEEQPAYLPDRFESGTVNLPGVYGLHAALQHLSGQDFSALRAEEQRKLIRFFDGLPERGIRVAGPRDPEKQVGVASLTFTDLDQGEAADRLSREYGILTRVGLHCAPNAHKTLGTYPEGTVRFSFGPDTGDEEIDRALSAIRALVNE